MKDSLYTNFDDQKFVEEKIKKAQNRITIVVLSLTALVAFALFTRALFPSGNSASSTTEPKFEGILGNSRREESAVGAVLEVQPCPGDTRGDKRCNHDPTHRVCANIGLSDTSFWEFTGQTSWCGSVSNYGKYGDPTHDGELRCPESEPSWCICKWATARWIKEEGCNDNVQFNCAATDVCNLKNSYDDFNVNLKPAHDCMKVKCKAKWDDCP